MEYIEYIIKLWLKRELLKLTSAFTEFLFVYNGKYLQFLDYLNYVMQEFKFASWSNYDGCLKKVIVKKEIIRLYIFPASEVFISLVVYFKCLPICPVY